MGGAATKICARLVASPASKFPEMFHFFGTFGILLRSKGQPDNFKIDPVSEPENSWRFVQWQALT
jgi:hypothetical protein